MPRLPFLDKLGAVARPTLPALALVLLAPLAVAALSTPQKAQAASTPMPTCAWPRKSGVTAANLYWPDSSAVYWSTVYPVDPDLRITVSGTFPNSRYMSFNVYDENTAEFTNNGVTSGLPDYRIVPDAVGANPWRLPGDPGGQFTVTVRNDVAPGQTNVLPLAPPSAEPGTKASLIFRVYLPTDGDSTVVLPTITLTHKGVSTTLPRCTSGGSTPRSGTDAEAVSGQDGADALVRPGVQGLPQPEGTRVFARTSEVSYLAPNADNGYLGAWISPPQPGHVVLIRARAPRAVTGSHPTPWPRLLTDVRYWSMCTNLGGAQKPVVVNRLSDGRVHYGCRYNDETKVDATGYYTFALGTEDQRETIEAMEKVTFLPFSVSLFDAPHMILLRHLLPTPTFPYAIQNVPVDSTPDETAEIMGAYYPLISTCSLESLTLRGPARCKRERG